MNGFKSILLSLLLTVAPCLTNASDKYEVTATKLNVRSGPGIKYQVVGQLEKGEIISVVDRTSSYWYKLETNKGIGYVSASYVMEVNDSLSNLQLVGIILGVSFIGFTLLLRRSALKSFGSLIVLLIALMHILFGWWGTAFITFLGSEAEAAASSMGVSIINFFLSWVLGILAVVGFFKNVGAGIITISIIVLLLYVVSNSFIGVILAIGALFGGILVSVGYSQIRSYEIENSITV